MRFSLLYLQVCLFGARGVGIHANYSTGDDCWCATAVHAAEPNEMDWMGESRECTWRLVE